jgi:(4S)-4-hydroxy-5-phosphonooxypentane-2,3-dione isomerase
MLIAQVSIHVKPDQVEAFKAATLENARNSAREPGIARFDVVQQVDDPTRFMLIEVFRNAEAPALHRETAHFKAWLAAAADMMAEPRTRAQYTNIFPNDSGWDLPPGYDA